MNNTGNPPLTDKEVWRGVTGDVPVAGTALETVVATANQIDIDNTDPENPVASLSSTLVMPGTCTLNADPVSALQAATKQYVDAIAAGIDIKMSALVATTTTLNATYSNGSSGVGATLTNAGALAAFSVDGQTPAINSRVLVKNQASTFQNGIYTLTTVGSGAVAWVLTRATDYDTTAEITPGNLVPVETGSVNAGTSWLQTATVTTIGTDPITFTQFTYGAYSVLQNGSPIYGADSVGTDAYAITLTPAPAALTTGMVVNFKAGTANTGNATLNVNSLGALNILKNFNQTLATNDIKVGQVVTVVWDGTNWQMQSQVGNVAITPSTPGVVVQVVSAALTTTVTTTNTTMTDSGLSVSITPTNASNKIMVIAYIPGSATAGYGASFNLVRDSTALNVGSSPGSRIPCTAGLHGDASGGMDVCSIAYLDSPSTTSSTTYKIQFAVGPAGGTATINRSAIDSDSASYQRTGASITVMEVTG